MMNLAALGNAKEAKDEAGQYDGFDFFVVEVTNLYYYKTD